jgi:hypothetical protein
MLEEHLKTPLQEIEEDYGYYCNSEDCETILGRGIYWINPIPNTLGLLNTNTRGTFSCPPLTLSAPAAHKAKRLQSAPRRGTTRTTMP